MVSVEDVIERATFNLIGPTAAGIAISNVILSTRTSLHDSGEEREAPTSSVRTPKEAAGGPPRAGRLHQGLHIILHHVGAFSAYPYLES